MPLPKAGASKAKLLRGARSSLTQLLWVGEAKAGTHGVTGQLWLTIHGLFPAQPATMLLRHLTARGLISALLLGSLKGLTKVSCAAACSPEGSGISRGAGARGPVARFWYHFPLCHIFKHQQSYLVPSMGGVYLSSGLGNLG